MDAFLAIKPMYTQEGAGASAYPYMAATIVFTLLMQCWERYLDWRQHKRITERGLLIPEELTALVAQIGTGGGSAAASTKGAKDGDDASAASDGTDASSTPEALLAKLKEKAPASQAYALEKSRFKFYSSTWGLVKGLAFVLLGAMPYFWDVADATGAEWFPGTADAREIKVSLLFYGLWEVVDTVLNLPWAIYSTFVVEARHGFNKTTPLLFATDFVKQLLLTAFLGAPCLAAFLSVVKYAGPANLAVYVGGFFFCLSLTFITVYPVLIQPLFNKYEPLEVGPLRAAIEALAQSVSYPLYKLYTVDGSKRSSHSNAYLYGFFKAKRIVLFDTLLKQCTTEEIVAILAHELGHWSHSHVLFSFCFSQCYIFVAFSFFARAMGEVDVYRAFGFAASAGASDTAGAPVVVGVLLFFMVLWEPVDHALSFVMTWNTRRMEFQADEYGANLGYAAELQRGLVKITFENLGVLDPDPLFSTYHHSHPPLIQRLRAIDGHAKKRR